MILDLKDKRNGKWEKCVFSIFNLMINQQEWVISVDLNLSKQNITKSQIVHKNYMWTWTWSNKLFKTELTEE